MMKTYRNKGAIGALLDEYEKALTELQSVITTLTEKELMNIVDDTTNDPNCKSIQTILTHVISAGYNYVIEIRRSLGEQIDFKAQTTLRTVNDYQHALNEMFRYNEQLFDDYPDLKLEEHDLQHKIVVRWGQHYDVEQLIEHAIVHILKHRRQIERFK